jgi:trimethylamine--corrinoid protein Co-methyltransferase
MARPGLVGGQYCPLSQEQVQQIHLASLAVLEQTGVAVANQEAQDLYRRGGARVDGQRVHISAGMVEAALETTPSRVLLAGGDPAHDLVLEGKRVYAGTGGSPTYILDPAADSLRPAVLADLVRFARLADALTHCDFVVIPIHPTDVPEELVPINRFYACVTNTSKHVMGGLGSVEAASEIIKLGTMIAGSLDALRARPVISAIASWMVSPLQLDTHVTDILLAWCKAGLPVALSSAPMAGSTSPATLAGTLTQLNAEQVSGIVLTQLARPGTPVLAGYIPGLADMRSGGYLGGAVEFGMMQAAAAQMAHFYQVPIYCSGGMSDAKLPDAQAGQEKMATLLLAAMGGGNYIHHAIGMVSNMNAVSLEQAIMDDEIVGMVMRVLRGIQVDEETMATEAIDRVGPGGHYLMVPHTLSHMRSEYFYPAVADRQNPASWEASGKLDARARAVSRLAKIMESHRTTPLSEEVEATARGEFRILV